MQNPRHKNSAIRNSKAGFTIVEMMIASLVLVSGLTACMMLIITAMANDGRSKNDSTATLLSQLTMEMISAVPANSTNTMTVVDCNPTGTSASHTISTTGSGTGAGAPLSSGAIDFSQATVAGYAMTYYGCQASTGDRQMLYDVRWNIKTISTNAKLVVVAAKPIGTPMHANFLAVPVTLKMIVGL
jgi:Tfp pilus assembly protein PilV